MISSNYNINLLKLSVIIYKNCSFLEDCYKSHDYELISMNFKGISLLNK